MKPLWYEGWRTPCPCSTGGNGSHSLREAHLAASPHPALPNPPALSWGDLSTRGNSVLPMTRLFCGEWPW